ncbi:MAG: hypothetical protein MJ230_07250 [bacterium]|nr:hypothetical protein [bacterium]
MTNGDKIRTYNNKELASLLTQVEINARINEPRIIPTEYAINAAWDELVRGYEELLESEMQE